MKNNIFRLLVLTLSVLMLLSLSLVALTGCDDDKTDETTASTETATEAGTSAKTEIPTETETVTETPTETTAETEVATSTETVTEAEVPTEAPTETETETEAATSAETESETETEAATETETVAEGETEAPSDDLLTNVSDKLSTSLTGVVTKFQQDLAKGEFSFSMPLNAKVDVTGHLMTSTTAMGFSQTTETKITASVTVAEGGLAISLNVPDMATVSIVCTDRTVYLLSEVGGFGSDKSKITIDDEMLAELIAYINGSAEGGESNPELEQIVAALAPIANVKLEDVINSITYNVQEDGSTTVTFKGIKDTFVATLNTILGQLGDILPGESEGEDEIEIPEISVSGDETISNFLQLMAGIDWDGFQVNLTVDKDAQILNVSLDLSLSVSETIEGLGDMTMTYTLSFTVNVTRGGQTVTAPADADSYEEMDMSGEDEIPQEIWEGDYILVDADGSFSFHEAATDAFYAMDDEGNLTDADGNAVEKDLSGVTVYVYVNEDGTYSYIDFSDFGEDWVA